ncbi:hypothetical protein SAMN02982929_07238 [Saccharopolyspora kobensis]|uniref:Uncharacterized protein n=1 Tax=Saccharopolyspora kobensis TaxID=146035 RepID=A0A1H6ELX3_9PSEU|nr:hypothetical protein [Saccharopolyspora kobensis]SEG98867.1 hypothetical protein SAMN02982929_07238 [Saccharopolyspora kobensis]SFD23287.1 hypothetical protein SAMN05216506_103161 [Saccharopolyspora kobensis]
MPTMPTFETGHNVTAAEWNAHATQINDNTSAIATNSSSIAGHASRIGALEYNVLTQASDFLLYGDRVSTGRRVDSVRSESTSNGFMTAFATISPKTFTATQLRMCVTAAAVGASGTFDVSFLRGPNTSNLVQQWTAFGAAHVTTTGLKTWTLPSVAITAGEAIGVCIICTAWTTPPSWSSSPAGSAPLINSTPYSVYQPGRSYPPETPINMSDAKWTRSNQLFWFAVA